MRKTMIEYSTHESTVLGTSIGRLMIDRQFDEWDVIKEEISKSNYEYLRIKVQNPLNHELDRLNSLCKTAHLLEIVRSYTTYGLNNMPLEDWSGDFNFVQVDATTRELFFDTFKETYEDIPFGSYTPETVFKRFDLETQRTCLSSYFYNFYTGNYPEKAAYLIYHHEQELVGCLSIDFFETESYSYYVGVKKAFRKNNILLKSINFIHRTTQSKKLMYAKGSARLHNLYSQKAFDKSGMLCTGYDWIYLLEL
jgi:hypothetical protein